MYPVTTFSTALIDAVSCHTLDHSAPLCEEFRGDIRGNHSLQILRWSCTQKINILKNILGCLTSIVLNSDVQQMYRSLYPSRGSCIALILIIRNSYRSILTRESGSRSPSWIWMTVCVNIWSLPRLSHELPKMYKCFTWQRLWKALMGKTSFANITYIFSVTAFLKCTSVYMTVCGIYLKTFDFAVSN